MKTPPTCREQKKSGSKSSLKDFHAHQLAFVGFSNSGKTTLLSRLIERLSSNYRVGYAKSDSHGFQMDKKGKDTDVIRQAGADVVWIESPEQTARIAQLSDELPKSLPFQNCDMVLVEGHKSSHLPKVLILDGEAQIAERVNSGEVDNIIATVGPSAERDAQFENSGPRCRELQTVPHFQRDDIQAIEAFVLQQFDAPERRAPLKGLVLAGGHSQRMGRDKHQLVYHGKNQLQHSYELLSEVCGEVYISGRSDQNFDLPSIDDRFIDMGPMSGILSAMLAAPTAAYLCMAVDMPFINTDTLQHLIDKRKPLQCATAFLDPKGEFPEPLCCIYEPKMYSIMMSYMAYGVRCPRKVLINSRSQALPCPEPRHLANANTPDEYQNILKELQS